MQTTVLPRNNLDILRGAVAVQCVFIFHAVSALFGSDFSESIMNQKKWLMLGRIGVIMFFVHTSLVLMGSLEKMRRDKFSGFLREFAFRRILRIYPLAIVTLVVSLSLGLAQTGEFKALSDQGQTGAFAANLFLVQNFFGQTEVVKTYWSLPLELQMYAFLPFLFLIALMKNKQAIMSAVAGAIALGALELFAHTRGTPVVWRFGVLMFAPAFMGGVLAFWILKHAPPKKKLPGWAWLPSIIGLAACAVLVEPRTYSQMIVVGDAAGLLIGCLIPFFHDQRDSKFVRISSLIAKYSYGEYLLHTLVLGIVSEDKRLQGAILLGAIALAFATIKIRVPWQMKGLLALSLLLLPLHSTLASALLVASMLPLTCWAAYHYVEEPGMKIQLNKKIFTFRFPARTRIPVLRANPLARNS